jgi:hypothetical protein
VADGFYAACEQGWQTTFAGIRRFLAHSGRPNTPLQPTSGARPSG